MDIDCNHAKVLHYLGTLEEVHRMVIINMVVHNLMDDLIIEEGMLSVIEMGIIKVGNPIMEVSFSNGFVGKGRKASSLRILKYFWQLNWIC